jgi:hypothetical protein
MPKIMGGGWEKVRIVANGRKKMSNCQKLKN